MFFLRQSTAATLKIGPFIDETDGDTVETGLTVSQADVRLSKNGGTYAQKNDTTACTHDANGMYACPLDTTDTNTLGRLQLLVNESGALPVIHEFMILPANVYDAFFSTDKLQVDVTQWLGAAVTADTNVPEVHVVGLDDAVITAAKLAASAITADKIAADAITSAKIATDAITSDEIAASAANEIADALLDRATAVEGYTPREVLRLVLATLVGKLSGAATTTVAIRDIGDTKDRVSATVDADGNRTAVTLDAT